MKQLLIATAILATVGCTAAPYHKAPAIAEISDSMVVVHYSIESLPGSPISKKNTATMADVQAQAERGCALYDAVPVSLSQVCGSTVYSQWNGTVCASTNYLFSCQKK